MNEKTNISIIGGGFAGCEAALTLSRLGHKITLYEARPEKRIEPFPEDAGFAFPVCSNSFKTFDIENAHGLLKAEMMCMRSSLLKIAHRCRIPAGRSLTVDRNLFSKMVTEAVGDEANIDVVQKEASPGELEGIVLIASGPLSTRAVTDFMRKSAGEENFLYFYDAVSPIISFDSIDMKKCFFGGRYDRGSDYINCPMTKDEYENFYKVITEAESVEEKPHEKLNLFSGCMPVEEIAKTGHDALRYGVMKPVGFDKRFFAVVQLRRENREGTIYNIVGFQTKLKFSSQKIVVAMIPGLENADIVRYGVMHRNFYVDSPKILNRDLSLKSSEGIFLAGQITGTEGYMEAVMSGLFAAYSIDSRIRGKTMQFPPEDTITGSLLRYITENEEPIKPMNANFGLLKGFHKRRKREISKRAILSINSWMGSL